MGPIIIKGRFSIGMYYIEIKGNFQLNQAEPRDSNFGRKGEMRHLTTWQSRLTAPKGNYMNKR